MKHKLLTFQLFWSVPKAVYVDVV